MKWVKYDYADKSTRPSEQYYFDKFVCRIAVGEYKEKYKLGYWGKGIWVVTDPLGELKDVTHYMRITKPQGARYSFLDCEKRRAAITPPQEETDK